MVNWMVFPSSRFAVGMSDAASAFLASVRRICMVTGVVYL